MSWLVPFPDLTPEQQRAVQLSPAQHRAIVGGPGSGKSQVLLHRAAHLGRELRTGPDRFRVFVFTNVLKSYIRAALRDLNLPEESVVTFDGWCADYYRQHFRRKPPFNPAAKGPDFRAIRAAVSAHALSQGQKLFDFVLVDEGQDLDEDVFTLLGKISKHVTVCLDNKQKIYDTNGTEASILHRLGIRQHNVTLIDAYRVCPYLVEVAAALIPDPEEREAFRNQARQPQTARETPLLYLATSFADERRKLFDLVRQRLLLNERVGILVPQTKQVYGFAEGFAEAGIEVEVPDSRNNRSFTSHDFSSDLPKLMTIYAAKGLTFDSVFVPRLVANCFAHASDERIERLLFVAITRATTWCYLSTYSHAALDVLLERLAPLADEQLTIEDAAFRGPGQAGGGSTQQDVGDDEDEDRLSFL